MNLSVDITLTSLHIPLQSIFVFSRLELQDCRVFEIPHDRQHRNWDRPQTDDWENTDQGNCKFDENVCLLVSWTASVSQSVLSPWISDLSHEVEDHFISEGVAIIVIRLTFSHHVDRRWGMTIILCILLIENGFSTLCQIYVTRFLIEYWGSFIKSIWSVISLTFFIHGWTVC